MDAQTSKTDWRTIILLILSFCGAALSIGAALLVFVLIFINKNSFSPLSASPLSSILTASMLFVLGLLLLPAGILSLQRLRGRTFDEFYLPSLGLWGWIIAPGLWLATLILATLVYDSPGSNLYSPIIHFLSIALPIYLLLRIGINRIPLGSIQRAWGVFATGFSLSILIAIFTEVFVIIIGLIGLGVYMGLNPDKISAMEHLINQIEHTSNMESLIYLVNPLIKSPLTLIIALTFLSVLVPIIEESAKSLGVWLIVDRLTSTAQGFALGFLTGAGFALAESLSATLIPDESWSISIFARAISGMMHMLASGLVGWGIASAKLKKRYSHLAGFACLAFLIHASWNAGAVFVLTGGLRVAASMSNFDVPGIVLGISGLSILLLMVVIMFFVLIVLNLRLRTPSLQTVISPEEMKQS